MAKEDSDLYVGIDLGTSRSSIAGSNNQRHMVESYVGWPVDMVARKILKRSVLVGRDVIENRSMLEVHRPLERGLLKEGSEKDQEAIRELLRHLTAQAGAEEARKDGIKVRAVVGVPSEALRVNRQHVREAMAGFVDSLIIVTEPFAVAYGLEALLHALVVDIGAGTTDFCVMSGRYPTDEEQRTLDKAGDWVDQQLSLLLAEHHPGLKVSIHTVREWKEKWSFVGKAKKPVKVTFPIAGKPTELDITDDIRAACEGLVPPISETMRDLIASVEAEYQERVRHNIILSGGSSAIAGLAEHLKEALVDYGGAEVQVVKDPIFAGADGGLALALDASPSDWEKLAAG
jgi:rod shape-determining protein MreB